MNLEKWRNIFITIGIFVVLITTLQIPSIEEPFFAMAVLGEDLMATNYFPENILPLSTGTPIHWYIHLYNHMGQVKYVAIRVKVLNSEIPSPNSTSCTPSPTPAIYEFRRIMVDNETMNIPFTWTLLEVDIDDVSSKISKIRINESQFNVDVINNNTSFRLVLELWVYDITSKDFIFLWPSATESRCIWNQFWFEIR